MKLWWRFLCFNLQDEEEQEEVVVVREEEREPGNLLLLPETTTMNNNNDDNNGIDIDIDIVIPSAASDDDDAGNDDAGGGGEERWLLDEIDRVPPVMSVDEFGGWERMLFSQGESSSAVAADEESHDLSHKRAKFYADFEFE